MSFLQFLFYLGIINIIFGFVWKWLFALPAALLFAPLKFDYGMKAMKVFGTYLLVSLTAMLTLFALGDDPSGLALFSYPLVGAFVLFMGFASYAYEARKEASATMDWPMIERLDRESRFEAILMFGALGLYLATLFLPEIGSNALTGWLFGVVGWAFDLPVIGALIGIGGILFLASIIFYGIFAAGFVVTTFIGVFRRSPKTDISLGSGDSNDA